MAKKPPLLWNNKVAGTQQRACSLLLGGVLILPPNCGKGGALIIFCVDNLLSEWRFL